ncbi:MAG: sulfatase-like hydrolase/transferase [Planctomycetes bacterium]|nr:sulfatase-like hydrolase/transferase [Planctomycetota bacterium]MCB9903645.1 sulfatase-like hydrolase/transferase [Planctomycetota bacterium]
MRRPCSVLATVAFLAVATWLILALRKSGRPNSVVVLVVVDTLRADTAYAERLAGEVNPWADASSHGCARFTRAYSSAGWTLPSVASLLTGVDPEVHHAHGKATLLAPLSPDVTTLAESFRAQGFRTVAVTNAAFLSPSLGLDRGFDVYDHEHAYNRTLRRAEETVVRAIRYAEEARSEDLFLFVHIFDPHLDYDPVELSDASTPPVTLAELRALEEQGGPSPDELRRVRTLYEREALAALQATHRLWDHFLQSGRFHDLLFAMTADHGEEFYEHEAFEHGHGLHTELTHVPLWISRDKLAPGDLDHSGVVSTRDLGRLLLESLELDVPTRFHASTSDWNDEGGGTAYSATTLYGPDRIALRTDTHAAILELHSDAPATGTTYDLRTDPTEQRPLPLDPELLRTLLDRRRASRTAGQRTRRLDWLDLGPTSHAEREATLRSLESLGYTDSTRLPSED